MDTTTAERIARRFVTLPLDQRQQILEKLQSSGQSFRLLPIVAARQGNAPLPLSYAQQRLLFLWQLEPQSAAYNVPTAVRLHGELNQAALRQAFSELIGRHEALRTHFISEEGVFYQVISDTLELPLQVIDLQGDEAALQARIDAEFSRPFDLLSGPLLRIGLWRLAADEHVLTLCQHHIISDGWSAELLVNEFAQAYAAALQETPSGLPALPIQYADYALWQRAWLEAGEGARQLAYWQEQLGDEQPLIALPTDHPRPAQPSFRGGRIEADIQPALAEALKQLARQGGHTLFMLMLAALGVTLSRFCGQDDIRIGTPNAGRNRKELEGLVGFFINTQVLRLRIDERQTFNQLLEQVREVISGAQSHQDLPFEQLVEALAPERSLSHNPLFQVKLNQNLAQGTASQGASQRLHGLDVSAVALGRDEARFDLALDFSETATGIHAYFSYARDLFEATTVQRLADAFKQVLRAMVEASAQPLLARPVTAAAVAPLNHQDFPCSDMLQLWRRGLALGAEGPALRHGEQVLSYAGLEAESNRLARYLAEQGVVPGAVVGLSMERCIEWVVSWLAVLKAGAVCLPLDPGQPASRLQQLAADSAAQRVICAAAALGQSPFANALGYDAGQWQHCPAQPLSLTLAPEQAAYVIYTSGSTGQPKGVVISHGALADYVQGVQQHLACAAGGSMALVSTPAADLGHTQLFGALASGVLLHLIPQEYAFDPDRFAGYMAEHQVAVLKLVPSHLQGLLQAARPADVLPGQLLILGGERCDWALVEQVRRLKPGCRILNHYGPTETTVGVLAHPLDDLEQGRDSVPLGTPLANARVAVLDPWLLPVAERVAGELYLGGPGVAQGYLGQPGLTAERFIPAADGGRWYRSGDRVHLDRQRVVFLGRNDDQLKVRGYRVELGEVAQALRELEGVQEAVVQAVPMDNDAQRLQLLAWCVAAAGCSAEALKAQLQARLPEAMVPAQILLLDRLPLTANGKLDKRALPLPDAPQGEYVAPSGEIEQTLARVWAEVLKLERVGAHDNFFELGGDSILSLQIIARAKRQGVKITPKQLFERQTVARLAQVAKAIQAKAAPLASGPDAAPQGRVPLVPAQARFFDSPVVTRQHWNQSILLTPHEALEELALAAALEALVAQHDALRLSFRVEAGQWLAEFVPTAAPGLLWRRKLHSFDELEIHAEEAQRSLDLQTAQLLRAVLFEDARGAQRLLLIVHHLVVDGVSWRVLLEDLQMAYQQCRAGQPLQLPGKTSAFKDWAERLQAFARDPQLLGEQDYWQAALDDGLAGLLIGSANRAQPGAAGQISTRLDATQTQRLLKLAPVAYRTQVNDLLLAALAVAVRRYSGETRVSVMLEGHGREELFDGVDLSRTLGWFTSLFPLRLSAGDSLAETIKGTKEQLRSVPRRGVGYGVLRYLADENVRAALASRPQPRLVFNYLGQFDGSFDQQHGSLFTPAGESAGTPRCPQTAAAQVVSIDGQVYGGELSLAWSFNPQVFAADEVQALARHYQQALLEVIEQCAGGVNIAITPSDVPLAGLSQAQLDQLPVAAADIEDVYPLSPMQHGMLFHSLLGEDRHAYVNQLRMTVSGLDVERLRQAWQAVVDSHDVLRSSVLALEPHAVQIIRKQLTVPLFVLDWREPDDGRMSLEHWAEADRLQGFDLARGPLMRLTLIRTGADSWQMVYTSHHLLMDGWSSTRLQAEVLQRYAGLVVAAPVGRYRDYIEWLGQQDARADQAFWTAQLAPLQQPTRLGSLSGSVQAGAYGEHQQLFDAQQTAALEQFARQQRVTVNSLVQSAWLLLLQALTGDACVAFGATVAGRPMGLAGIEEQLGLFINTLPVVAEPQPQMRVGDWLRSVQALNLSLREHEHSPLFEIQRWAGHGGEALFDSLLVFENYPLAEALAQGAPGGLRFSQVQSSEQTNYPLTLVMGLGETLAINYAFDQRYFAAERIELIAAGFRQLLLAMSSSAEQCLGELSLLSNEGQQRLINDLNRTAALYPHGQCLHALIEAQAAQTPDATALLFAQQRLSYAELNRRANRLAHQLRERGVGPDVLVGIAAQRSVEMVVGLLAILKAGGAYVPLDPDYPWERLAYMIEDSGIQLLLTQQHLGEVFAGTDCLLLEQAGAGYPESNLLNLTTPANLAYVIYTSGSTGRPKGAGNSHQALVNRLHWMQKAYALDGSDTVLQKTPFSFDVSVWEFFWPLLSGARLALAQPGDHRDPQKLIECIHDFQVSTLHFVPSMLQAFMASPGVEACSGIRRLICSGEALAHELAQQVLTRLPNAGLYNLYGPTEAAIDVTHWTCAETDDSVPIGRPIDNLKTHVLSPGLLPVPEGVNSELYLGGVGLARGYHGRPGLTAERFVPDPFDGQGGRLYRTGDLARYRADGAIEYAGRLDHQVKIRGLRIELGEIDARAQEYPQVREAVVLDIDGPLGKQLVGYLVPKEEGTDPREGLKAHLKAGLPDYMVPAQWILLQAMPLSPNGKLDRKALPSPDSSLLHSLYVEPETELQQQLAAIWADVLKVERVGLHDDFFELGGHSLLVMQVIVRLRGQLAREIAMAELFEHSRLGAFAERVAAAAPQGNQLQDELAKSLEALKRLSMEEIDELTS